MRVSCMPMPLKPTSCSKEEKGVGRALYAPWARSRHEIIAAGKEVPEVSTAPSKKTPWESLVCVKNAWALHL